MNSVEILLVERARDNHSAGVLTAGTMLLGAAVGYGTLTATASGESLAATGMIAATVVGVTATLGRWIRSFVLPRIGASAASSSAQISALVTATGGVLLLDDSVHPLAATLSLIAAAAAFVAVVQASRPVAQSSAAEALVDVP